MSRYRVIAAAAAAGAALLVGSLSACAGDEANADPRATPAPGASQRPYFDAENYTYTLTRICFCIDGGFPLRVTVTDGEAVQAVYLESADGGHQAGEVSHDEWLLVTINDAIDLANSSTAYRVDVDWPADQAWPTSVYVDRDKMMADEELGYEIADVTITG